MELFTNDTGEFEVKAACFYTEEKVTVWFDDDKDREQFFWGEGEQYRDELEAIKAADAFVKGILH